mgnify:CR=1 FL=1
MDAKIHVYKCSRINKSGEFSPFYSEVEKHPESDNIECVL